MKIRIKLKTKKRKKKKNEEKINENVDLEENNDDIDINKEDINNIVEYLTNLDFDKYSRDMEIKEALMVLKTKMDKDQELKEKEIKMNDDKVTIIEVILGGQFLQKFFLAIFKTYQLDSSGAKV